MNLSQQIYTKACEAAASLTSEMSPHELITRQLAAFDAQGLDPLDYHEWQAHFNAKRNALLLALQNDAQIMARLAAVKAPSELKLKPAAAATTPPTEAKA